MRYSPRKYLDRIFADGLNLGLRPNRTPRAIARFRPLIGTRSDQLSLELGEAAKNGQHKSAVRGGGVGPGIGDRAEARALLRNGGDHVQQVARAAGRPIKPRHKHTSPGPSASIARCSCLRSKRELPRCLNTAVHDGRIRAAAGNVIGQMDPQPPWTGPHPFARAQRGAEIPKRSKMSVLY